MSSFFTTPASQKKRKRPGAESSRPKGGASRSREDDESISSGDDEPGDVVDDEESEGSDDEDEDAVAKRIRLAEQYLANTRQQALDEGGFDAADIDQENLRSRTGERLKEDTAESKGKMYRLLAGQMRWQSARHTQFRADTKSTTGIAMAGAFLYTVSKDMALIKWRVREGREGREQLPSIHMSKPVREAFTRGSKKTSSHHQRAILCVAASADGKFVATGGADNKLIIWSADTLRPLKIFTGRQSDNGHRDSVMALSFRRGTNQLFSASKDRTVKIWSCNDLSYIETLFGHQDEVLDVDALGKETCVSVGGRDRTARYWRVVEETQLVFRGGGSGVSKKRDQENNHAVAVITPQESPHEGSIDRIAFVDDDTFITGSDNGVLSLWNIHKKKAVFTLPLAHGLSPPPSLEERNVEIDPEFQYQDTEMLLHLRPQPRWITALAVLPFSDVVVSGSWDGSLRAFQVSQDRRKMEPLGTIGASGVAPGIINDLAIAEKGDRARDGLYIAAAVGKEHRLGRWTTHDAKNGGLLFDVPRTDKTTEPENEPALTSADETTQIDS